MKNYGVQKWNKFKREKKNSELGQHINIEYLFRQFKISALDIPSFGKFSTFTHAIKYPIYVKYEHGKCYLRVYPFSEFYGTRTHADSDRFGKEPKKKCLTVFVFFIKCQNKNSS